ncbi:OmpA family protein [Glycomyces rhizosphaerae]|uniref:OmpA family protein n=1 Tax=Glycomyces rhizosphaerae TaxID=2054422 RepID=A0ABV7PYQ4_9ACTN
MPTSTLTRSLTAAGALATLVPLIAACGGESGLTFTPPDLECEPASNHLSLVWGARANNPAPELPAPTDQILYDALADSRPVEVVVPDGAPTGTTTFKFEPTAGNDDALKLEFEEYRAALGAEFAALRSEEAEADTLGALSLAGRSMTEPGVILVVDSGLQTLAPLDFPGEGLLAAEPDDVAAYLEETDYLPDLKGQTVVWVGLGDTAAPQEALPTPQRNDLRRIWTAVIEAAGGCVEFPDEPLSAAPIHDDFASVTPTAIPESPAPPEQCGTTVYDSSSALRFNVDQDVFVDPDAARETLSGIADLALADDRLSIKLTGTTSSEGADEDNMVLSESRAEAVKAVLVDLGVPADRIATEGVGSHWPGRENDIGAGGELLPGPAAKNRAVVVELACPAG